MKLRKKVATEPVDIKPLPQDKSTDKKVQWQDPK